MSDDTPGGVLVHHLTSRRHNETDLWHVCGCMNGVRYYNRRDHAAHQLERLRAAGFVIVTADVDAVAELIRQADPLHMQHNQQKNRYLDDYRAMARAALGIEEES